MTDLMTNPMTDLVTARWMDSAALAPAGTFDGRYFCTTVAWARAWESVRSEQVREFRHLALEGGPTAELVPYYLVDHSPLWQTYEENAGMPPVWSRPPSGAPRRWSSATSLRRMSRRGPRCVPSILPCCWTKSMSRRWVIRGRPSLAGCAARSAASSCASGAEP